MARTTDISIATGPCDEWNEWHVYSMEAAVCRKRWEASRQYALETERDGRLVFFAVGGVFAFLGLFALLFNHHLDGPVEVLFCATFLVFGSAGAFVSGRRAWGLNKELKSLGPWHG